MPTSARKNNKRTFNNVGYENYQRILSILDETTLDGYNKYVARYLNNDIVNNSKIKKSKSKDLKNASNIIKRNAIAIKNAGSYYGVNPAIIAACIYTEQVKNVNIIDSLTDILATLYNQGEKNLLIIIHSQILLE